jgi:hypothetical protein
MIGLDKFTYGDMQRMYEASREESTQALNSLHQTTDQKAKGFFLTQVIDLALECTDLTVAMALRSDEEEEPDEAVVRYITKNGSLRAIGAWHKERGKKRLAHWRAMRALSNNEPQRNQDDQRTD